MRSISVSSTWPPSAAMMRWMSLRFSINTIGPCPLAWLGGRETARPHGLDVAQVYQVLGPQAGDAGVLGDRLIEHVLQAGQGGREPRLQPPHVVLVGRFDLLGVAQVEALPQDRLCPLGVGCHSVDPLHE